MNHPDKNSTAVNDEPIQIRNVILIVSILVFGAIATIIKAYFNDYTLEFYCQKQRPKDIAICQIIKVNLLKQKTTLFENQPITTLKFSSRSSYNTNYSAVNSNVRSKWCKAQLYNEGEIVWEFEHTDRTRGQNCFGYDDSSSFIAYLENQQPIDTKRLTHHYQLVIYRPWGRHVLTFLGWFIVGCIIFSIYSYIRLEMELRKIS